LSHHSIWSYQVLNPWDKENIWVSGRGTKWRRKWYEEFSTLHPILRCWNQGGQDGKTSSTHGDTTLKILVRKLQGKRLVRRPRRRWNDIIRTDHWKGDMRVWTGLNEPSVSIKDGSFLTSWLSTFQKTSWLRGELNSCTPCHYGRKTRCRAVRTEPREAQWPSGHTLGSSYLDVLIFSRSYFTSHACFVCHVTLRVPPSVSTSSLVWCGAFQETAVNRTLFTHEHKLIGPYLSMSTN
jgi:hypothetical protein